MPWQAFEDAGVTEFYFDPTTASLDQIDRLADLGSSRQTAAVGVELPLWCLTVCPFGRRCADALRVARAGDRLIRRVGEAEADAVV